MDDREYEAILAQARHLSVMIRESSFFTSFNEKLESIGRDREAGKILELLIEAGSRLVPADDDEFAQSNRFSGSSAEAQLLHEGLNRHPIVTEFLTAQREYLTLLNDILARVKNPHLDAKNPQ